jgi:hypothetical protein
VAKPWCVHVLGPDTVIAQPDEATARERAAKWQAGWDAYLAKRGDSSPNDPKITWQAAPWPHSPKAHARDLAEHGGDPKEHC